jgi:hypothetical protein
MNLNELRYVSISIFLNKFNVKQTLMTHDKIIFETLIQNLLICGSYLIALHWVIPENIHTTPTEEIGS